MAKPIAVINGTVYVDAERVLEGADVLIRAGKIAGVGRNLAVPPGAEVIDARGKIVTPGFIDAHTHMGNCGEGTGPSGFDFNEATDAATPHVRALDGVNPRDPAFEDARRSGVTTVCVLPGSANVIGGTGVVLKTAGTVVDKMVVRADAGMKVAFGENPKVSHGDKRMPQTRMGTAALLREMLTKAAEYKRKRALKGKGRAASDFRLEPLARVLAGEMPLRAHAHRADDIATAIRVAREFECRLVLDHCTEGHLVAEFLKEAGVPCVVGPSALARFKVELRQRSYGTAGVLADAGCAVALTTDHPFLPIDALPGAAAIAIREGMDERLAFAAVTRRPAEILALGRRLGRLAAGYDGDVAVWTDHPFSAQAKVVATVINGQTVYRA